MLMEGHKNCMKVLFVWTYQILLLDLSSHVQQCSGNVKSPEGGLGELDYADNNINYNIDSPGSPDMKKITDHSADGDFIVGYDVHQLTGAYNDRDDKLFKRDSGESRTRAKIRRMMKRNRLFHQGRLGINNISTVEENNSAIEKQKTLNKDSSYSKGTNLFGKENTNKYAKSSLTRGDKGYKTNNGDSQAKGTFDFPESSTSNAKNEDSLTSESKDHTGNEIHFKINNIDGDSENPSNNYTFRELKKDAVIAKHKKGSVDKIKISKEKNKDFRKHGFISPIKKLLRKKIKSKIHSVTDKTKIENVNEGKDEDFFTGDSRQIDLNKNIENRKTPGEGLSYGLEENLTNLSLINHGFLKAFEKKYFDNHFNETPSKSYIKTKPLGSLQNYTAYEFTLKSRTKPNDWKAWDGFNIGDYYEPQLFFHDKEPYNSKSPLNNKKTQAKNPAHELTDMSLKYSRNKHIGSQNQIPLDEREKLGISRTNNGKCVHDKKKRYMYSGKSKHKVHEKPVDNKKTRGARDTTNSNHKSNIYSSRQFLNDKDSFDYEENKAIGDEIYNRYSDAEKPSLVFQVPEQKEHKSFYRLKKDDSYFKKPRSNKLKNIVNSNGFHNENQFRISNSRKSFESNYNADESTETCIGYKSEDMLCNTTDIPSTVGIIDSTVTTKRNNNGKTKIFSKAKKLNVDMKNITNRTEEIDEHSLFLCGQLADDFIKAVFTKIRRSRKLLKELGFSNETDQSCDRCIETKPIKLPDLEIMKGTLGKCCARSDLKHKNSKCNVVPDPMESFLLMLLSLGKEEDECVHNRLRDDSSFIFNGDDLESLTKIENGPEINSKYSDARETVNKATFDKQDLTEESDEEKVEDKGSKSRPSIAEDTMQDDKPKNIKGEGYQSNEEESDSKSKSTKVLEHKGSKQDAGEHQLLQSEENLKGNDLIEVFESQDSSPSIRRKYPSYAELQNAGGNNKKNNINDKLIPHVSSIDYNGDANSYLFERKKYDYLNEPRKSIFVEDNKRMKSNVVNPKQEIYYGDDSQRRTANSLSQKLDINALETHERYPENVNPYDKTSRYLGNSPSRLIKSNIVTQNIKKYPSDHMSYSAAENNMGDMEYQLYPGQMKDSRNDISYNALPFYDDTQRMGKRETPSDTNEDDAIFFELPDIEYDLY